MATLAAGVVERPAIVIDPVALKRDTAGLARPRRRSIPPAATRSSRSATNNLGGRGADYVIEASGTVKAFEGSGRRERHPAA